LVPMPGLDWLGDVGETIGYGPRWLADQVPESAVGPISTISTGLGDGIWSTPWGWSLTRWIREDLLGIRPYMLNVSVDEDSYYWAAYDFGLVTRSLVSLGRWPTGKPQTPRPLPERPYHHPR
jgi:hypothetical protein